MSTTVLIYGVDPLLLETRRLLLTRQGFGVVLTRTLGEVETSIRELEPSVAIFCSSLTHEEKEEAITLSQRLRPEMKKLVVEGVTGLRVSAQADSIVDGLYGPIVFIDAVRVLAC